MQRASALAADGRETGLKQIVGLSQWLAGHNPPALMSGQHWLIDRMFGALPNIAHTAVTPGFFADSPFLEMMPIAAHLGILPLPVAGESRNAPPSVDDIARVAVAALLDPARHAGKQELRPTGPKLLTVTEMASIIGRVVATNCGMTGHGSGSCNKHPRQQKNHLILPATSKTTVKNKTSS